MEEKVKTDRETIQPDSPRQFHSDEVQELMGRRPAWILRWGVTILILIITGTVTACWFIKYPQTVSATITLTSDNPPSDLAARVTGILDSVYVSDGDTVMEGQLIALVASTAHYEDVICAEEAAKWGRFCFPSHAPISMESRTVPISQSRTVPFSHLQLGNIQQYWNDYLTVCTEYKDYMELDQVGRKQKLLTSQVRQSKEYYRCLEMQRVTISAELEYERRNVKRDSLLFTGGTISQSDYETSIMSYISMKNTLAGFDATMADAHLSRLQLEQQILELGTQKTSETAEYERKLAQSANNLLGQIALWKEQYTVTAPYDGIVSLQNVWSKGQRVSIGDILASVSPAKKMEVIGRLKVPSSGFGKVKVGQTVNVRLNGFPYLEFGILKGKVLSISSVPEKAEDGLAYTVDVTLPDGLESSYHKALPFVQNMDGEAEIITEDLRLIEHFIQPIRSLFVNR